jgi:LPXTG-motif cell wall-anchored protein
MTNPRPHLRLRRVVGVVMAAVALGGLVVAMPAGADEEPCGTAGYPPCPEAVVDDPVIDDDGDVTFEGDGFNPDSDVDGFIVKFTPDPPNDKSDEENLKDLGEKVDKPAQRQMMPVSTSPNANRAASASFALATDPTVRAAFAATEMLVIPIGTTRTDAQGRFRFNWKTAGFPKGGYEILLTDGVNSSMVSLKLDKAAPDAANGGDATGTGSGAGSLPQTGGVNQLPLRIGALLLAAGGVAVLAGRRRRRSGFTVSD